MEEEPHDIEDVEEDTEVRGLGPWVSPSLDECPVVFLGFLGERVWFAMPEGEIRDAVASKVVQLLKVDIFNSPAGQAFLGYWRDKNGKFAREMCATWFVRCARETGKWDASKPVRGLGVWPAGGPVVVLHRGSELWRYGPSGVDRIAVADAMRHRSHHGPIYALQPETPEPAEAPATAAAGLWYRKTLDWWRFEEIGEDGLTGADIVAGHTMAGLLGAVPAFRPHCLIHAMRGSGKTTLMQFVHSAQGAVAGDIVDSFSGPGFRLDLAGNARPVLMDEAEATVGVAGAPGPVEEALNVLRRMSTGLGATRKQGDASGRGGAVTQTAIGMALIAAVNPPRLGPADASRIVSVRLLPLSTAGPQGQAAKVRSDAELLEILSAAQRLGPALLTRALMGAGRFTAEVSAIKAHVLKAYGDDVRTADLVAVLAAGRRLLLYDDPLSDDAVTRAAQLDEEVRLWRGLVDHRAESESETNTGVAALQHLFAWRTDKHWHDRRLTVGDLIERWHRWRTSADAGAAAAWPEDGEQVLKNMGLIVEAVQSAKTSLYEPYLLVATNHPELARVFDKTPWGDHRGALGFLDTLGPEYATTSYGKKPKRFAMHQSKAFWIPLTPWLVR